MSILNDYRRYSDNEDEYMDWEQEVEREYRKQEYQDREREYEYERDYDSER